MRYTYNWRFAYNVALYAVHGLLTGHKVGLETETGTPFCDDTKCGRPAPSKPVQGSSSTEKA